MGRCKLKEGEAEMTQLEIEEDIAYVEKYLLENPGNLLAKRRLEDLYKLLEEVKREQVQQ